MGATGSVGPSIALEAAGAAPVRLADAVVAAQAEAASAEATILAVLDAFPGPAALLNDRRQVLFANAAFRTAATSLRIGMRPGDALGCTGASCAPDGCGTGPACAICGSARGFRRLEAGEAGPVREECLLTRDGPAGEEWLEYEAGLTRLPGGLTMLAMRDISGEKRRRVLERCFLHDALNAAGGVQGLADLAAAGDGTLGGMLPGAAAALVDELRYHQAVLAAESGELAARREPIDLAALFDETVALHAGHRLGRGRRVVLAGGGLHIASDRVLLRRVVGNLLKNALEASPPGACVEVTARLDGRLAVITVRNQGEMPLLVQRGIFRRYISTKSARGRGIGTWSVKLLVERYLGGSVSFRCADGCTEFTVALPAD